MSSDKTTANHATCGCSISQKRTKAGFEKQKLHDENRWMDSLAATA